MSIFILFVSAGDLFEGDFSLLVTLTKYEKVKFYCQYLRALIQQAFPRWQSPEFFYKTWNLITHSLLTLAI